MKYEIVIGLETHVRVGSITKMFGGEPNAVALERDPNINIWPVSLGLPGALPILSEGVVDFAVRASHGLRMTVNTFSQFDRKSYFYPDLPMGYQITQLFHPISEHGHLDAFVGEELKRFKIRRIHIEADAGGSKHSVTKSLIDFNRAGSPLMEIVTEPDFRGKEDVLDYLKELQKIMRFVGASDADMEKGQLRCDVNISLRPEGSHELRNRVELKNLNSFQQIGRAIDAEVKRQIEIMMKMVLLIRKLVVGMMMQGRVIHFAQKKMRWIIATSQSLIYHLSSLLKTYIDERKHSRTSDRSPSEVLERMETSPRWCTHPQLWSSNVWFLWKNSALSRMSQKNLLRSYSRLFSGILKKGDEEVDFSTLKITPEALAKVVNMLKSDEISSTNAQEVVKILLNEGLRSRRNS
jgi:aspartyl-tRNA(Asn)/glutamyl-tRNA(Gln) amidotransferase subunit B